MLPVLAIVAALGLVGDDLKLERRIDELLKANPLIDGHNDLAWAIREHGQGLAVYDLGGAAPGHTDIARLRKGRVGAQLWSVYVPADKVSRRSHPGPARADRPRPRLHRPLPARPRARAHRRRARALL
jgi:membrane dipeptidase